MEAAPIPLSSRETVLPSAPTNIPDPAPKGERMRIGFLGPFGTFAEQAVRQIAPVGAEFVPITSASHALAALCRGEVDRTVAPIEDSIEGGVNVTLDSLAHGDPLVIIAEMVVPVVFQPVVRPDTRPENVHEIDTHPHVWAQYRNWVEQILPGAIYVPTISTVTGAQLLVNSDTNFDAALCSAVPVDTYEIESLFRDVADNPGAVTRFVLVAPPGNLPAPTGAGKTAIQIALSVNELGALLTLPEQFAVRGVDLSRIEFRSSGDALGDYTSSIDIVGYVIEERVRAALVGLHRYSPEVRFTGSYPRVDGRRSVVLPGTRDEDFQKGCTQVADLLHGGNGVHIDSSTPAPPWPLLGRGRGLDWVERAAAHKSNRMPYLFEEALGQGLNHRAYARLVSGLWPGPGVWCPTCGLRRGLIIRFSGGILRLVGFPQLSCA